MAEKNEKCLGVSYGGVSYENILSVVFKAGLDEKKSKLGVKSRKKKFDFH